MTLETQRHQQFAANFASVATAVNDWDARTPVEEWRARDVVAHLIDSLPPVLENWANVTLEPVATDPPAENWVKRSREVHRILDSPATAQQQVNAGPFAGRTVAQVIDRIYTADIYMHTWDLARAAGLQPSMDPQFAETMLAGMHPIESMLRDSGQFGLAMHTDSTDPVDQLMAFVGRQV